MGAIGLQVDTTTVAVGQVFGARDLAFAAGADFSCGASVSAITTVGAIGVCFDADISTSLLTGWALQFTFA